jgi:hypothetical protein
LIGNNARVGILLLYSQRALPFAVSARGEYEIVEIIVIYFFEDLSALNYLGKSDEANPLSRKWI